MTEEQKVRFLLPTHNSRKCPNCGAMFGLFKHKTGIFSGKTICMNCGFRVGMTNDEYMKQRRELRKAYEKAGFIIKKVKEVM